MRGKLKSVPGPNDKFILIKNDQTKHIILYMSYKYGTYVDSLVSVNIH